MCYNTKMPVRRSRKSSKLSSEEVAVVATPVSQISIKGKLKKPRVFIPLIIVILILVAFFFKGLFVVALVNGEPITRIAIIQELEKQGGKQTLSSLINQTLILQEARKKNVQVSQDEINAAAKKIEDSLKGQGQNLDTALAMQGMTKQDFLMQLRLRSLVEKLLADKIKVSDKEIADYIDKNKETIPAGMKEEEIKKNVTEQLKQQKLATESQTWLAELNKNAKINYLINY